MLQKRLDYGFNGCQVPFIPRAARSARKRGPIRKKIEDKQLCAFDLLAAVAGNLLEGESSHDKFTEQDHAANAQHVITEERHVEGTPLKVEHCDQGGVGVPSLSLELGLQAQVGNYDVNETRGHQHDVSSALGSVITSSDCLEKDDSLDKVDMHDDKGELCSHSGKAEGCSPVYMTPCPPNINECPEQLESAPDMQCSQGPNVFDRKPPALATTDCNGIISVGQDKYLCGFPLSGANNVTVVTRDDDENLSECNQPSTMKTTRSPARIGGRRIRKLLASKYWRLAPKVKDGDVSETELHCIYRSRRFGYKRQRSQRIYPFKKRKYFHYASLSNSDGDVGCNGVYNSPEKVTDTTASGFGALGHGVNGSPSCVAGQSTPFPSRESHVKLRIKSFRVPELIIEMPETATVGSLKRRVMEAVTALLGGGLRVGVVLQGKKIRDDNRTLLQSGICHDEKVESLGFALEPNPSQTSLPACSEDNSVLLCADVPDPVSRCPATSTVHQGNSHLSSDHLVNNLGHLIESDHDSAQSPAEISAEKGTVDSRALVALPEGTPQALAVVPAHQKSKRSDLAQRRIRRPFSVAEVEALVQAVEKLGTGRWRDVKLRAFDNVKHRTYVDLKDKWKTLVHTARISPQQRRGEPVPQELLDRVLSAHAYWSQQQAKQQLKQQSEACLLL